MEEDIIREAPVVPTGGQAGRWQAITDTTTIGSSLVVLKEKGATPQDRRFLYVDCIKRTTAALGCRGRNNLTRPPCVRPSQYRELGQALHPFCVDGVATRQFLTGLLQLVPPCSCDPPPYSQRLVIVESVP